MLQCIIFEALAGIECHADVKLRLQDVTPKAQRDVYGELTETNLTTETKMTIGWTRRKLLKLTGFATMGAAMARAAEAEGIENQTVLTTPSEVLPTAVARPVHVGEVALRARDIGLLKRYYMAMLKL